MGIGFGLTGLAAARRRTGGHRGALRAWIDAARENLRIGNLFGLSAALVYVGVSLTVLGDNESAAVLLGAGDTPWGEMHWFGSTAEERNQSLDAVAAALGDDRFAKLHRRGEAMDDNEAVAFAEHAVEQLLEAR